MSDRIRIDLDELTVIARDLRRLVQEVEELCGELRLVQYRLTADASSVIDTRQADIRLRMDELMQRAQEAAEDVDRLADAFDRCEIAIKRRMLAGSSGTSAFDSPFFAQKNREMRP
ncbi:MAG: hypothetical protein ACI4PG_08200 [Candidatus Ventricola sp.]